MAGEWPAMSLREANVSLIDCDHRTPPPADVGYPYVAIPQIRAGRIDLSGVRRITPEHFSEWTRKAKPSAHDVVLSRRCNPGETAFVPPTMEFALGQNLVLLRADGTKVDPPFLRWLVRGPEWWEQIQKFLNVGAVFDSLRCADVPNFRLRIPPLDEQRAIAHILGTLDDKIELNRRMNETLEAMAHSLFMSWFVDFDPVRAKAAGRDPGLPKPLADLFPATLMESELGEIPEGWLYRPLGDLVELTRGTTYSGRLKGLPGPVLLGLASIARNGGFREERLSTYGGESPVNLLLRPGEIFASLKDVTQSADLLGAVARVPTHVKLGRLTQDTVKLSFRSARTSLHIVYRTLLTPEYREYCRSHATGTTNLGLSRDDFLAFPVVQPNDEVQLAFDAAIESAEARASSAAAESRTLAAMRDALLPKLISGELRVNNVISTAENC